MSQSLIVAHWERVTTTLGLHGADPWRADTSDYGLLEPYGKVLSAWPPELALPRSYELRAGTPRKYRILR